MRSFFKPYFFAVHGRAVYGVALIMLLAALEIGVWYPVPVQADSCGNGTGATPCSSTSAAPTAIPAGTTSGTGANFSGAAVSGAGSCAAGLLSSILGQIGLSVAGGQAAQAISTGGAAAAAGTVGAGAAASAVAVPTSDNSTHAGLAANATVSKGGVLSDVLNTITGNNSLGIQTQQYTNSFMGCIARSIARAIIQQVAVSTINWINSGFNGSPAFVSNPTQFFTNTANSAAGQYLQGSDLAFLCTPFALQVKIAIAQSYQSGGANSAPQCSLVQNLTGFMNNFQNGGWPAFISMTTNPSNQPFGAYIQGSDGLNRAVAAAVGSKQQQLSLSGGFLDFQQKQNCTTTTAPPSPSPSKSITPIDQASPAAPGTQTYQVCDLITVTPGKVISDSLSKVMGENLDELNTAKYFDEIISALITQLMTKTLQGGLLNLGGSSGNYGNTSTGGVDAITALQNNLLANVPSYLQTAQQLQGIYQQDVAQITPLLAQAQSMNCPQNATPTTAAASATVQSDLAALNNYASTYQTDLTNIQKGVATLNQYQSQAANTTNANTLENLAASFTAAISSSAFPDQAAVNGAQEDAQTLSVNLNTIQSDLSNAQTAGLSCPVSAGQPATTPAPTCNLSFSPSTTSVGTPVTLTWVSANSNSGSIDQGVGTVDPSGSMSITPTSPGTTRYTGMFTGPGGTTNPSCIVDLVVTP